jgi:hypothetical protein
MNHIDVRFYGYSVKASSIDEANAILDRAAEELEDGDIDRWYHQGCPAEGYRESEK